MKIAIGLPHLNEKIDARFSDSLTGLVAHTLQAGHEIVRIATYREGITFARNKIATRALSANCDYLFFLDDDMVFEPDTLLRLISHSKSIIGALTFIRTPPHEPSLYEISFDGKTYNPIYYWKSKEIVGVDAMGMAATLISKDTLNKLKEISVFHKGIWGFFDNYDYMGEDLRFCKKCKELGVDLFVDTDVIVGHITEKIVGYGDYIAMSEERLYNMRKFQAEKEYNISSNPIVG